MADFKRRQLAPHWWSCAQLDTTTALHQNKTLKCLLDHLCLQCVLTVDLLPHWFIGCLNGRGSLRVHFSCHRGFVCCDLAVDLFTDVVCMTSRVQQYSFVGRWRKILFKFFALCVCMHSKIAEMCVKSTYDLWMCWIVCDCRVPEECPQEVADVIASCLDENPTNRPTARQIVDKLG